MFIPPLAFKNCLDSPAKYPKYLGKQIPGRGKVTLPQALRLWSSRDEPAQSALKKNEISGEWRHVLADGMPGGSKRVLKLFPTIPKWEGEIEVEVLDDSVTDEILKEHLVQAGPFVGGGVVPARERGVYGRFKLVSLTGKK